MGIGKLVKQLKELAGYGASSDKTISTDDTKKVTEDIIRNYSNIDVTRKQVVSLVNTIDNYGIDIEVVIETAYSCYTYKHGESLDSWAFNNLVKPIESFHSDVKFDKNNKLKYVFLTYLKQGYD